MTVAQWGQGTDPGHEITHPERDCNQVGMGDRKAARNAYASNHRREVYPATHRQGEPGDVAWPLWSGCTAVAVGGAWKGR